MIVFCTTCKGRTQHLERTLTQNLSDNRDNPNVKFVVLSYNSGDHFDDFIVDRCWDAVERQQLVVYHFKERGPFRMAHAKNMVHRLGILEGADILVNLDADNYTGKTFADDIAETFRQPGVFMRAVMVKGQMPRGIAGRIVVSADDFIKVGGYDERFTTWAPEDDNFKQRLVLFGRKELSIAHQHLDGIPHRDGLRFKEYPHVKDQQEYTEVEWRSSGVVVNGGHFGKGAVYRNFCNQPIVLQPVPTRIFGIGMHKTATTSLDTALCMLGFDSAHWRSPRWARNIWEEELRHGRSVTLEQSYAICDLPIPLMFQTLDITYPGSKFILTCRDETKWLNSVANHWTGKNPYRATWEDDCFTHAIHKELYGQTWFSQDVFLNRYRRHNADVLRYFRNRPSDLLVLDIDGPDSVKWAELCRFLSKPVPDAPFPRRFKTSNA